MRTVTACLAISLALAFGAPRAAAADDWVADDWTDAERRALARHGWGTFFAQTGFAIAATSGALVMRDAGWRLDGDEPAIGLLMPALTGAGSALGYAFEGASPELGWALAGTWPGAAVGVSAALGVALLEAPQDPDALATAAVAGGIGGAALGALAWLLETLDHGRPGALTGCFWGGYFLGLASGFAAMTLDGGPEAQATPLIGAAVGAVLGVLVAEVVRAGTGT